MLKRLLLVLGIALFVGGCGREEKNKIRIDYYQTQSYVYVDVWLEKAGTFAENLSSGFYSKEYKPVDSLLSEKTRYAEQYAKRNGIKISSIYFVNKDGDPNAYQTKLFRENGYDPEKLNEPLQSQ